MTKAKRNLYEELRYQIITMAIRPGAILDERSLVDQYKVSRTPVREALIRLSADGLVQTSKNKGARVTILDIQALQSIFEAGDYIERAYVRLACTRRSEADITRISEAMLAFEEAIIQEDLPAMIEANSQFHLRIARASKNQYFVDSYRRILADHERISQWFYQDTLKENNPTNQVLVDQHRQLFEAIVAGDASEAEKASMQHATLCKDAVREMLSSSEGALDDIGIDQALLMPQN